MTTQHLAQDPPDAIAIDRMPQGFRTDDIAYPTRVSFRGRRDDLDPSAIPSSAGAKQRFERTDAREPKASNAATRDVTCRRDIRFDRGGVQGASRTRPLARRAESTLRPPTLFIRARKPGVRLRLMTDGWYVRFMVGCLSSRLV